MEVILVFWLIKLLILHLDISLVDEEVNQKKQNSVQYPTITQSIAIIINVIMYAT